MFKCYIEIRQGLLFFILNISFVEEIKNVFKKIVFKRWKEM